MEVSGQLNIPVALPPGKTCGTQSQRRKSRHCSSGELNPGRPARSLVSVPTELSLFDCEVHFENNSWRIHARKYFCWTWN